MYLYYKINNVLLERNLLQPSQRILVAVSGGQDSICIMRILYQLRKKWKWKLGIVHCDHRWNLNSQFPALHVASLAASLEIDYYQGMAIQSIKKEGLARIWRYDSIRTIAISNSYTAIVTGHTASDRIETLIYNLTRGSGLHGLHSINWKRQLSNNRCTQSPLFRTKSVVFFKELKYGKSYDHFIFLKKKELQLIRPFLETSRTEIRKLITTWNFPSWPDLTNKEVQIRRNRIRHRLLPYIRFHYNPKIDQALARWAEIVQAETFYLEKLTNYLLSKIEIQIQNKRSIHHFVKSGINLEFFRSLPLALQRRVLIKFVSKNMGRNLGFQHIEQIRLSCLLRTVLPSTFKNKRFIRPWIIFPGKIKLVLVKKFLFFIEN